MRGTCDLESGECRLEAKAGAEGLQTGHGVIGLPVALTGDSTFCCCRSSLGSGQEPGACLSL